MREQIDSLSERELKNNTKYTALLNLETKIKGFILTGEEILNLDLYPIINYIEIKEYQKIKDELEKLEKSYYESQEAWSNLNLEKEKTSKELERSKRKEEQLNEEVKALKITSSYYESHLEIINQIKNLTKGKSGSFINELKKRLNQKK